MGFMEELDALGADTKEGIDRVMGDQDLYREILGIFVDMVRENPIGLSDFDGGDYQALISTIHTLKGTAGNLSLTPLFEGYTEALELLRADNPKEAKAVMEKILPVQTGFVECIIKNRENA